MRLFADPKRLLPMLLTGVAGILILVSLVWPNPAGDMLLEIAQITTAVGLLLGLLNVVAVHIGNLRRRTPGWPQSVVLLVVAVAVFALELVPEWAGVATAAEISEFSAAVFRYVYQPLATSILGLLTFFALRASWRALYLRPGEAIVVLLVAVFFLVAGGPWAAAVPGLQESLEWIRAYPALGVARGLVIGVSLGALVATIRVLLGLDQPYLDR